MYNSKTALIIDLIFAAIFAIISFVIGITHWGEPYNELYFAVSFICGVLVKIIGENAEKFKEDK